jgi:hypothetical protein
MACIDTQWIIGAPVSISGATEGEAIAHFSVIIYKSLPMG